MKNMPIIKIKYPLAIYSVHFNFMSDKQKIDAIILKLEIKFIPN